jgi:chlorite dismutase
MTNEGWALWAVFRRATAGQVPGDETAHQLAAVLDELGEQGITTRGVYDVSGFRADAEVMFWLHGDDPAALQAALRRIRRTAIIAALLPTWNAMGVHRDAEFNRSHVPGFLRGERPREWLAVYPFVRGYDWYVLPEDDRKRMLAEHGRKGAANTVSAFALGDYEWILPLESDSLTDVVDMMRALRATEARLHVNEETPFFTGRRIELNELPEVLS